MTLIPLLVVDPFLDIKPGDIALRRQISGYKSGMAAEDAVIVRDPEAVVVHREAAGVVRTEPHAVDVGVNVDGQNCVIHHVTALHYVVLVLESGMGR